MIRRLSSVPALLLGWLLFRGALIALTTLDTMPRGDVAYYFSGIYGDDPTAMTEYPHAGVWPTELLGRITGADLDAYYLAFFAMCLLLDAGFLIVLRFFSRSNPGAAAASCWFWIFFGTFVGHIFIMRLDLFPGIAVALAAMLIARFPAVGSMFLALATTMKLWPGVLAAGLVGRVNRAASWLRIVAFVGSTVALCAITIVTSGVDRLLSPLTYQGVRGLQVESVAATPFVIKGYYSPGEWTVKYASSKSFEISGPGVDTLISVSTIAMAVVVLGAAAWALYRFVRGGWAPHSTVAFFIVVILGLMVTNKVFSPQYMVWIAPVIAVALAIPRQWAGNKDMVTTHYVRSKAEKVCLGLLAFLCLVAAALGTYVFPFAYDGIITDLGSNFGPVIALTIRNILVVVMFIISLMWFAIVVRTESKLRTACAPTSAPVVSA